MDILNKTLRKRNGRRTKPEQITYDPELKRARADPSSPNNESGRPPSPFPGLRAARLYPELDRREQFSYVLLIGAQSTPPMTNYIFCSMRGTQNIETLRNLSTCPPVGEGGSVIVPALCCRNALAAGAVHPLTHKGVFTRGRYGLARLVSCMFTGHSGLTCDCGHRWRRRRERRSCRGCGEGPIGPDSFQWSQQGVGSATEPP